MADRRLKQQFIVDVVPTFRDAGAWEDLAWQLLAKLNDEQLTELLQEYEIGDLAVLSSNDI